MSAVSAIGLQLCPMATSDKCSNESDAATSAFALSPQQTYQIPLEDKKADPDVQVNVYVSAIINHNNITINSDKAISIDTMSVDNITAMSAGHSGDGWQKLLPSQFQFLRSLINESGDSRQGDTAEKLPSKQLLTDLKDHDSIDEVDGTSEESDDDYVDPCSHPEYIVFTWVSFQDI